MKLGDGEDLYALFAGILTMRPWNRVIDPAADHLIIKGNDSDRSELQGFSEDGNPGCYSTLLQLQSAGQPIKQVKVSSKNSMTAEAEGAVKVHENLGNEKETQLCHCCICRSLELIQDKDLIVFHVKMVLSLGTSLLINSITTYKAGKGFFQELNDNRSGRSSKAFPVNPTNPDAKFGYGARHIDLVKDSLESRSEACRDFFGRLKESLAVWGSILPFDASDGINDVAALAASDIGVALGGSEKDQKVDQQIAAAGAWNSILGFHPLVLSSILGYLERDGEDSIVGAPERREFGLHPSVRDLKKSVAKELVPL
ncbi:hypothetical protein IFM89_007598 [Coptis chinensis]|uniref:Uncharacterized protein n=1 Tax=Coptis chinensis TaxID=261450 RepID=A0A835GXU4_9MAGN|nr:hypothetical protein IFM89_007598 [Coptis chinensis]